MIHEFVRMCESVGMAQTVCVLPPAEDRERLLAVVADRNRPLKHVQRARIVLYSADRLPGRRHVAARRARAGDRGVRIFMRPRQAMLVMAAAVLNTLAPPIAHASTA